MILAINTSTLQFGLALLEDDGTLLGEYFMSEGKGHFGNLMPALQFLLFTSKSDIRNLETVVVAMGPGSFTGLRVGLAVAKGLCHAFEIPVIGIGSLEAMANQIPYSDIPIAPVLDSRRGEIFTARFIRDNDHDLVRDSEDISLRLEDLPSFFKEPALFIGNDVARQGPSLEKMLGPLARLAPGYCWSLKASALGSLGLERFRARTFDDPRELNPIYLRPPDIRKNTLTPKPGPG